MQMDEPIGRNPNITRDPNKLFTGLRNLHIGDRQFFRTMDWISSLARHWSGCGIPDPLHGRSKHRQIQRHCRSERNSALLLDP